MSRLDFLCPSLLQRWFLLMLCVLLAFCLLNSALLSSRPLPDGDLASDMLIGNDLVRQGFLLHGHYSRWGFNHPGPFWFYWNHFFERLLVVFHLSRFQVWLAGSTLTSAVLLSFGAASLSAYLTGAFRFGTALLIVFVTLGLCGHEVSGLWMPWRIVLPYFCFLVMLLWITEGRAWALPIAAALCGVLIHGYITMPIFTLPLFIAAVGWGHRETAFLRSNQSQAALLIAALILLLFATPVLWDALGYGASPSNFSRVLTAQSVMKGLPKPGLDDLVGFYRGVLRLDEARITWILSLTMGIILFFSGHYQKLRERRIKRVLALSLTLTLMVFVYYARTPLPIFPFIAVFGVVAPLLLMASLGVTLLQSRLFHTEHATPSARRFLLTGLLWGLPAVWIVMALERPGPPYPAKTIQVFTQAIEAHSGLGALRLFHEKDSDWPLVSGLLVEWEQRGSRGCVMRPDFEVVYTPSHICSLSESPDYELVDASACGSDCIVQMAGRGLRPLKLTPISPNVPLLMQSGDEVLLVNWSEFSGAVRWSLGNRVGLVFRAQDPEAFEGRLEMQGTSLGPQTIRMEWNGHAFFDQKVMMTAEGLNLSFPKELIRPGSNILRIDLPDARMPGNGDLRILGLRLRDLRIH